jgi:hypothetical protein
VPEPEPEPENAASGTVPAVDLPTDPTATFAASDPGSDVMPGATAGPGRVLASTAYLVYLYKRGTFYPFVPNGHEHRDTEEELKLKSLVSDDLVVEADLDRWFPLWDLPVG